jgi:hypothetical protein
VLGSVTRIIDLLLGRHGADRDADIVEPRGARDAI